jgi:cytochrome b
MASIEKRTVLVWDAPTRLFHWLIVALVAIAYVTQKLNWMDWHAISGDCVLVLLLFRLAWGAYGGETARFVSFLASPRATFAYLAHASRREPDLQIGHNPAGGWMVMALLGLLLGETLTGLYALNDIAQVGPLTAITPARLANTIDTLHSTLWEALLAAVTLHVLAIATYAAVKGHDLVTPMITGRKTLPEGTAPPDMVSHARAAFLFAGSVLVAVVLINFV